MTPVDQRVFEDGKGDCLRACVASILDLSCDDVPNFAEADYIESLCLWLGLRGVRFVQVRFEKAEHCSKAWYGYSDQPVLLWGKSPRVGADGKEKGHAVVGRAMGYGFRIIHDPHPSREGLSGGPYGVMWIDWSAA